MFNTFILVLLCTLHMSSGFLNSVGGRRLVQISSKQLYAKPTDAPWAIDEDSSEVDVKSSADLRREKEEAERLERERVERERLEQERLEQEKLRALFVAAEKTKAPTPIVPSTPPSNSDWKVAKEPEKKTNQLLTGITASSGASFGAFDAGLLIAFPVIVGTLMLFFLFPLLGPEFAKTLPPVPLN